MIDAILAYFRHRKMRVPSVVEAVVYAQTEMGEVFDALMRNGHFGAGWVRNAERTVDVAEEIADAYMMLELAASASGFSLQEKLREKMIKKTGIDFMTEVLDGEE